MSDNKNNKNIMEEQECSTSSTSCRRLVLVAFLLAATIKALVVYHQEPEPRVVAPQHSSLRQPLLFSKTSKTNSDPTDGGEFAHELDRLDLFVDDDDSVGTEVEPRRNLQTAYGGSCHGGCGDMVESYTAVVTCQVSVGVVGPSVRDQDWLYKNKNGMVHVVHTRFMLHQGYLMHLGEARMDLMKTFTLPSMAAQSLQQFVWIMWVDPELAKPVKCDLLQAVSTFPNLVVIAWDGRFTEDFRSFDWETNIEDHHLWHGTKATLLSWHEQAQKRAVLETRLDADDALHQDAIKNIQKQAKSTIKKSKDKTDYRVWCSASHLEWRYYTDYEREAPEAHGRFVDQETPEFCVTPGLTIGYQLQASVADLPTVQQCKMHHEVPPCGGSVKGKCLDRIDMGKCGDAEDDQLPCFVALRPRSPTDHGMKHVMPNFADPVEVAITQEGVIGFLHQTFGIDCTALYAMRAKMELMMHAILQDAYRGQCTQGHSCKGSARRKLEELIWTTGSSLFMM